jgi:hypothetical protein
MRFPLAASLLVLGCAPLIAQTPAAPAPPAPATSPAATSAAPAAGAPAAAPAAEPAPISAAPTSAPAATTTPAHPPQVDDTSVGFSYGLPSDWEFVAPPPAPKVVVPYPTLLAPRKGDACIDIVLTAKHGSPGSVVVVLDLPFSCYGQTMTADDLVNFGAGAVEGMKQTFELKTDAVEATYSLGGHKMWAERVHGTPKGHPENRYVFEIACTLLEKGAACWMTMAADWADLKAFEEATVSLEGDQPAALVPRSSLPPSSSWVAEHSSSGTGQPSAPEKTQ